MSLDALTVLIEQHGPLLFFVLGFAEFIGVPVATVPALIAGGALARMAPGSDPALMVLAATGGGWIADAILFAVTRWKGAAMVDRACGLTSNPNACVLKATERVKRTGPLFIYWAKFVPGVGNLSAPAAALAGVPPRHFLGRDLIALLLWAGAYTAAGWLLSSEVEVVLLWISRYLTWVIPVAVGLIVLGGFWRVWRVRTHTRLHEEARR